MATFVNSRSNKRMINLRSKHSSNSLLHNRLNNLNFNGLNLEAQNVVIPPIAINPSTSVIKIFIYEVISAYNPISQFSFRKLIKKNKDNEPIRPIERIGVPINTTHLFTKNFIGNTNINNSMNNIGFLLKDELNLLYNEYTTYSARKNLYAFNRSNGLFIELQSRIYNNINHLLDTSTQIMQNYYIINKFDHTAVQPYDEIIIKLNEATDSKIIVMGDQHGSFHSFFRLISRLIISGIIDNNYILQDNYKIIFLGDIVDRGFFGIEIMYIILRLFIANNTENELKIIINRGNHEEECTFKTQGFSNEIKHKINNTATINNFTNFYKYCSSAIILTQNNITYWLCHGGFPENINILPNFNDNKTIYLNNNLQINSTGIPLSYIRWNDFTNKLDNSFSSRGGGVREIGTNTLSEFLNTFNINFIIRGHTDNDSNAMLLRKGYNKWYKINNKLNKNTLPPTDLITYLPTASKTENEIAFISPNNFDMTNELYPVLTISNNCDKGRSLYNDSYVIIESVTQNGGKVKKNNNKSNKLIDTFKKLDLVKIAKKYDVSLKTKDGSIKSKEQLFKSLKRKKLI
jgi:hypothetical protein